MPAKLEVRKVYLANKIRNFPTFSQSLGEYDNQNYGEPYILAYILRDILKGRFEKTKIIQEDPDFYKKP